MAGDPRSAFARLKEFIGPFPERTDLEPQLLETVDCKSYFRHKVEYSVERDERVRAYLLIPKNLAGRSPAVFCHHQHAGNYSLGKSEVVGLDGDPDQALAHELAERGFVTFAPDAIAFEERNWSKTAGEAAYFELATRLVQGQTLMAKVLQDIAVGTDYMESRDEVDSDRIGFIGHSYGGRMAIWAPAFDKRIIASVSNCGCARYEDSISRDAGIQMEVCVPGIMQWGDIEDVVKLVEPSSLLISAAESDKWSRGAQKIFDSARPSFIQGTLELKIYEGGHSFTAEMREAAYRFLERELGVK